MAMTISPDTLFALTVSADHLVVRYNLFVSVDLTKSKQLPGHLFTSFSMHRKLRTVRADLDL